MAIEKMKKLRLIAVREQKDELLKDLMLMGCVEVSEPENMELSEQLSSFIGRENGGSSHYRAQQSVLVQSIEVLNKYAPEKGKLLSAKPETDIETLLDDSETEKVYGIAEEICESDDRIKRATSEESRIRGTIESLAPWLSLELPLECEGTASCTAVKGGIPAAIELNEVIGELAKASELSELVEVSRDKDQHYLVLVCINEQLQQALDCVRNYGFTIANFSGMSGTAAENTARLYEELAALAEEGSLEKPVIAENVILPLTYTFETTFKTLRGDMNFDGKVNTQDAVYLLRHTMRASKYPLDQGGDVNGDSETNSADAIYLLRFTLRPKTYPLS